MCTDSEKALNPYLRLLYNRLFRSPVVPFMAEQLFPVAILAGGVAKRVRPLTETIPKALIEVAGEPFLAHQLRLLKARGIERVVVCTGYRGDMIEQYLGDGSRFGLRVSYSHDGRVLLGTAGAVRKAVSLLGECFFVLYGDSYLPCDYWAIQQAFEAFGKSALMTVFRNEGRFDASNVEFEDGRILIYDKRHRTPRMMHIDYGLGVFRASALGDKVPENAAHDLADVYQDLLAEGNLAALEVRERFYEIGSFEGIKELDEYLLQRKEAPCKR
jgi:MurNAc alpha-1-phosphate uridylyltransferase